MRDRHLPFPLGCNEPTFHPDLTPRKTQENFGFLRGGLNIEKELAAATVTLVPVPDSDSI